MNTYHIISVVFAIRIQSHFARVPTQGYFSLRQKPQGDGLRLMKNATNAVYAVRCRGLGES